MMTRGCLLLSLLIFGPDPGGMEQAPVSRSRGSTWPSRIKRSPCSHVEYRPSGKDHCCNKCPKGHFVHTHCPGEGSRTHCEPCRPQTFLAYENSSKKCKSCTVCDQHTLHQIEMGACTANTNTKCGCPSGKFQKYFLPDSFTCENCTVCQKTGEQIPCKRDRDTVCKCEPGLFYDQEKCVLCDSSRHPSQCPQCQDASSKHLATLGIVSCSVMTLMGLGIIIYCLHKKSLTCIRHHWKKVQTSTSYTSGETTIEPSVPQDNTMPIQEEGGKCLSHDTFLPASARLPDCVQIAGTTPLPDNQRVNYTIVDLVPAFRWREFVRLLGLGDVAIERAELEAAPRYREAQYLMLRQWRQVQGTRGASLETVYAALRNMDLTHCAEQLQEKLCTGGLPLPLPTLSPL